MVEGTPGTGTPAQRSETTQPQVDSLIAFMKNFWKQEQEQMSAGRKSYWKSKSQSKAPLPAPRKPQTTKKVWKKVDREPTPSSPKERLTLH